MRTTQRQPSTRRETVRRKDNYSVSPYLIDEIAFTLEEIRQAREAA